MHPFRRLAPLVLALAATPAAAAPAIESATGGTLVSAANPQLWGWAFRVDAPVRVTALGAYDAGGDGLAQAHDVGLYALADGALLASASLRRGMAGTLEGEWRYATLAAPAVLPAGDYVVVVTMPRSSPDVAPTFVSSITFGDGIRYRGSAFEIQRARPRLALPTVTFTDSVGTTLFHANFQYEPLP